MRVHEAVQSAEPHDASEIAAPPTLRPAPRPARFGDLLPPSVAENEPPETVVHVSIGRIDVRAVPPAPAAERRPARPAGPRLTLADYLKGREERRR